MSGRQPVCEDAAAITARIAELRAERMRAIAGCHCPRDTAGEARHNEIARLAEAVQRLRNRVNRNQ